uniref:oxysterol-binding protein-related protein 9 isoform X3 n=1 Tax=Myxine glutinosa TaxID=7769 RepID=UPI00358E1CC2
MASLVEGPLSKWTNVMQGWQYRWFLLDYNTGLLSYYTTKEKMMRGSRRGCVRLSGAVIGIDDEDDSTFTITVDQKTFHFQARNTDEREKWINALEETIHRHSRQHRGIESGALSTGGDFDQKLAEADAYLQILIEQLKCFDDKLKICIDEEQRKKVADLKDVSISAVNPSELGLQEFLPPISILPEKTITHTILKDESAEAFQRVDARVTDRAKSVSNVSTEHVDVVGIPLCSMDSPVSPTHPLPAPLPEPIPEISYSSSEDEFYDANEFDNTLARQGASSMNHAANSNHQTTPSIQLLDLPVCSKPVKSYEGEDGGDDDDEEGESVEAHKSVILHLLSQVKLGMDLTKVVLPTFILERRSLLEMYADFFAHPELFTSIAECTEARGRMVAVVRWYLSAFHAGRRGSVAKKPYNPVLGEIFQCSWTMDAPEGDNGVELVTDGPVPWVTQRDVSFISEQVSHHPPISAFYAECYNKHIQFNAHIWTKSKFLGMSIGVHNIGQGCVSVLDYDEEYILTFPNGYGRSILTVPWVELGGECSIACARSGFTATITFHTKPFYGGYKHRITADIFSPNEKKSFCSIEGEWNGVMHAKWENGDTEVFVDTKELSITKKRVRKLEDQEEFESRRLWREVTTSLKAGNMENATDAKHALEERQRAAARDRKLTAQPWQTRVFHEDGECWVFDHPLLKRVTPVTELLPSL